MAGLPGYAPVAPKTLQAAQAQIHAIDQQQGFHAPVVVPPTDGSGFVAPGQGIGSAVRYDVATRYQGNDPAQPVNYATGAGMVQGGSGPVQGLPGVAVMPGVQRVGNSFSNAAPGLPAGVEQNGNSFTNVPPASLKQHLDAALTAHLQKSIQSAALPSWFNQEQRGLNGENQLHQMQATQQAQNAAQAAHLQAVQQQAQNSPITTGLNAAIHSVGSGVLGDVGGLAGGLGDLTGWKGAQQFGHNLIGASVQQAGKAAQQEAALSKAKGLGSYIGAGAATLAPYLLGPEVAANTFAQNAALQGAQNGDSFGRNLAGAALQGAAGVAGAPEARMVEDALHGITKNSIARALGQSALYGAAGGALGGAGQSITNDQTLAQGAENTAENAGIGALLGGGAGALTHGATSLAGKLLARKPAAEPAVPETTPTTAAEPDLEQQPTAEPAEDVPADDEFTRMLANIEAMKQTKPTEPEPETEPAAAPVPGDATELNNLTGINVRGPDGQITPVQNLDGLRAAPKPGPLPSSMPTLPDDLINENGDWYGPGRGLQPLPINFASHVDKAGWVIAKGKKLSPRDSDYLKFVKDALGTDDKGARTFGTNVVNSVKSAYRNNAINDDGEIEPEAVYNPGQDSKPAQDTAEAVQEQGYVAPESAPAGDPVLTPAEIPHGKINEAGAPAPGDTAAELRIQASDDASKRGAQEAAEALENMQKAKPAQTEGPNTQDQSMLDNLGASVMTPAHEKAMDLLQSAKNGRMTVSDLQKELLKDIKSLPQGKDRRQRAIQVIHDLVLHGRASLGIKRVNRGSPFLVARTGQPADDAVLPIAHQAVLAHLENQARDQMNGRIAKQGSTNPAIADALQKKIDQGDFSGEAILNPTSHATWMSNILGIDEKQAKTAMEDLADDEVGPGHNEITPLDNDLLQREAEARGASAEGLQGYSINSRDPYLTATTIKNIVKNPAARIYEGRRQSDLTREYEAMPDNSPDKPLLGAVVDSFHTGGDAIHQADIYDDTRYVDGAMTPKRSAVQLAEEQDSPVTHTQFSDGDGEPAPIDAQGEAKQSENLDTPDTPDTPEEQTSKVVSGIQDGLKKARAEIDPKSRHAATQKAKLDEAAAWAEANKHLLGSVATSAASHSVAPTLAMQKLTDFVDHILGKGRADVVMEHRPGVFGYTDLQKIALTARGVMHDAHRVLTHEAAHIIRELYLTDAEKKMTDQALAPGTRRYERLMTIAHKNGIPHIVKNQPHERFSYYAEAVSKGLIPKPTGILGRIYSKVLGHMERLHSALHGAGYKNIDDIMQAMHEGKFAERGPVRSLEEGRNSLSSDIQHSQELNSVAPDKKPSILDREMGYNIHNAMQEADDPSFIRKAAGFGAHVALGAHEMGKQLADQGSVPSVKAHIEAAFRPLWRAWENRYRTGREVESKVGHVAPIWFDPTLRNALKYRAARSTASKMLQDGDHERKVFDEDTLRSRYNANPDAIEAYQQALKAAGVMHDYDIQKSTENLAQKRKMALQDAADINKKFASPVEKERVAALKQAETLAESMKEAEALHKKTVAHTKRLRDEGYIPHFREGKYLLHVKAALPTGELAMRKYMQKLEKAMPETQKRLMDPKTSRRTKTQLSKKMEVMSELHARYQQALQNGEFGDQVHLITTGHHFLADAMGTSKKNEKLLKEQSDILKEYGIDPKHITTSVERKPAPVEGSMGMEAAQRLLEGLGDDGLPLSTKQRVALFRQMVDSESTGFNKRVARKDIAGEDDDVRKALAHWAVFTGEQMGAHRTAGERADAMRELRKSGSPELAAYAEAYEKGLHADGAQPGFEKAIRSATGLAMLGGNLKAPLYALQNMPFAMANLSRNERGMGSLRYTKALKDVVGLTAHKLGAAVDKGEAVPGLTKAETQTMWKAHQAGDLAPQYANLVLGAHGGSSVGRQAVEHALMSPLAVTENHLRMATYLAALRQHAALLKAGKKPLGLDMDAQGKRQAEMNPETYARDMSNLSNQNYQREDTIPLLGKLGDLRTMLQFATPQARNLSMLHHMARTNPLIGAALVAGAAGLGGYQALPLAEDAESGYDGLSAWMATHGYHLGSLGDGQGAQALINQGLIKNLPPKLAELAMHGGLHNVFGTDLSEFAGLGNNVGNNLVQLGADVANQNLHMIPADQAAPATSFVMGGVNTARSAANANWMQAARSLPVPLVENLIRAAEAAHLGRFTTPTGSTVMKSSPAQIAAATIGLPTTKLQDSYDELGQARYAQTVSKLVKGQALQDIQQAMEQPGSQGLAAKGNQLIQSYAKAAPWSHEFITGQDYSELMRRHMLNSLTPMQRLRLGEFSGRGLHPMPPVAVRP